MPDPLTVEVPAIALLGNDRILCILKVDAVDDAPEGDVEPERDVDWTVNHREERVCVEHGRRHVDVDYTEPDGEGHHTFLDPANTWLKVERPVGPVLVAETTEAAA